MKPIVFNDRELLIVDSQSSLTVADCSVDESTVDRIWRELCVDNPNRFNGALSHVQAIDETDDAITIHVAPSEYRLAAVQTKLQNDAESRGEPRAVGKIGIHPLGVKGITRFDGSVLMGKRSSRVGVYQNLWEFAPGGGVEPGDEPVNRLLEELREETGVVADGSPVRTAVMHDGVLGTFEIVYSILALTDNLSPSPEYSQVAWCDTSDMPQPLSPLARQMIELL